MSSECLQDSSCSRDCRRVVGDPQRAGNYIAADK